MAPRRRCPTCGSRRWHKEPLSGLIACSEGHVLQNYRNETTEVTEMGPHAMKKRTLKNPRKKKERESNADPKLYHGARGRYHYFLCLQLLLRKQVASLIKLWELPPEFEVVCRDVWALHLDTLRDPVPAEPFNYAQLESGGYDANKGPVDDEHSSGYENEAAPSANKTAGSPTTPEGGKGSSISDFGEDDNHDDARSSSESDLNESEIDELMKANSDLSSSSSEDEDDSFDPPTVTADAESNSTKKRGKGERSNEWHRLYESPASTIAVLVVGCWILRIPCLYRDLTRVIESYELPYLDPVRVLPPSMVQHLTKYSKQALSPHHAPSTILMHRLASRLAKYLYSSYAISIPEANGPSILWRVVWTMGGTPTLYGLTKRLASILSLPLTLHSSLAPGLRKHKKYDASGHQLDNVPAEVSLMASCIIVLKMVYGLDGRQRLPADAEDPACGMPEYDGFIRQLREMNEGDAIDKESVFSSHNAMRLEGLDGDLLDEYLDFCEGALLGPKPENDEVLDDHFPLGKATVRDKVKKTRTQGELAAAEMAEGQQALRPGEEYRLWNAGDVFGGVPGDYAMVLERGARWVGVSEEYLEGVVSKYEKRVARRQSRK